MKPAVDVHIKVTPSHAYIFNISYKVGVFWGIILGPTGTSKNAGTWLVCSFRTCISFHGDNSLSTMLENIKINLTHGSNYLFRLHTGKTLNK